MNIFLIGFMGAGKSTVSAAFHDKYKMEIAEMDQMIVDREGMAISDIFAQKGEEYFRNVETNLLKELGAKDQMIVSCGGGVALRQENVEVMKKTGKVVLLMAKPETILERVKDDHSRPLLEGNMNTDFIASMMEKRRPFYDAAAQVTIWVDNKAPEAICDEIMKNMEE